MNKKSSFFIFYILSTTFIFAQDEKQILGKIISNNQPVPNIQVINLVTEQNTQSDANGTFSIMAKPEDILVFASMDFEYKRYFLEQEDVQKNHLIIELVKKINQLKEVVITKSLNPVHLGIVPKGQKTYTPAERRLKTAGDFKPIQLLNILGGNLPIDPIINAISGRTKMLKKELIVERNELNLGKISNLFEDSFYLNQLHLPQDHIKDFQYYIIEDQEFVVALNSNNKSMMKFIMARLAVSFNEWLSNEK